MNLGTSIRDALRGGVGSFSGGDDGFGSWPTSICTSEAKLAASALTQGILCALFRVHGLQRTHETCTSGNNVFADSLKLSKALTALPTA